MNEALEKEMTELLPLTHLIEIISSLVQFMDLSPNKLMISMDTWDKGHMQNVQSRGSPGLELRTTALTHITEFRDSTDATVHQ